jgi:hypothetical protein
MMVPFVECEKPLPMSTGARACYSRHQCGEIAYGRASVCVGPRAKACWCTYGQAVVECEGLDCSKREPGHAFCPCTKANTTYESWPSI